MKTNAGNLPIILKRGTAMGYGGKTKAQRKINEL
jgi:hypothetical protein